MNLKFTLDNIKEDINLLNEYDFMIKYILKTDIWYFTQYLGIKPEHFTQKLDLFKKIIAEELEISFNNILLVGSSKVGFSLAPNKKLFQAFDSNKDKESDIDIAIISDRYFHQLWNVFRKECGTKYIRYYGEISSSVFKGFINENVISEVAEMRRTWEEKVNDINKKLQRSIPIRHKINYRIYRSWEDLQDYHIDGVRKIKSILESGEMR